MKSLMVLLVAYGCCVWLAPFPYWPTYFKLWQAVLLGRGSGNHPRARVKQAGLLLRYALLHPLWTLLWCLDELMFPAYRSQVIKPIFIIGQPRSGSTLLHRMLAADEKHFLAVRHIEWHLPFISIQKLIRLFGLADWLRKASYWPNTDEGRSAARMHPNNLYDWEEDAIFFEERFLHHYFVLFRFPYLDLLSYLDEFDVISPQARQNILETHRRVIQKMMYLGSAHRLYLSKEVESVTKMRQIAEMYPDATFIMLARRSSSFMNSLLALIASSTFSKTGVNTSQLPGWKERAIAKKQQDGLRLLDFLEHVGEDSQIRISFEELVRNITQTASLIYDRLGLTLSLDDLQRLDHLGREQMTRDRGYEYHKPRFEGFESYDAFVAEVDKDHRLLLSRTSGTAATASSPHRSP